MKTQAVFAAMIFAAALLIFVPVCTAEVVLDGTMGTAGAITGPAFDIGSDVGQQQGSNLFHSFSQFSISPFETATFSGPASIANIIARVTGGQASAIHGLLRSTIDDADLYLLNPAGILFGPGARLDLGGSFYASTADYLRFSDDMTFYSLPVQGELLSSAPPSAFGYLGESFGAISYTGPGEVSESQAGKSMGLIVPADETLAFIGGDITIESGAVSGDTQGLNRLGSLLAPEGQIFLVAVNGKGEVAMTGDGPDTSGFSELGKIEITGNSKISTTGLVPGKIVIQGGQFFMDNSSVEIIAQGVSDGGTVDIDVVTAEMTNGATVDVSTHGKGAGGEILLDAKKSVLLEGTNDAGSQTALNVTSVNTGAQAGDAGEIHLNSGSVTIRDGAYLTGYTNGGGKGGSIYIQSSGDVVLSGTTPGSGEMAGTGSGIYIYTLDGSDGAGDAGSCEVTAGNLILADGATITGVTYGSGDGGNVTLKADTILLHSTAEDMPGGSIQLGTDELSNGGNGGTLWIDAHDLTLADGATIGGAAEGPGAGGDINIHVQGTLHLTGANAQGFSSSIQATSRSKPILEKTIPGVDGTLSPKTDASGNSAPPGQGPSGGQFSTGGPGGDIYIEAGTILLEDGGMIIASSDAFQVQGGGAGDAGTIQVKADQITARGVNPYGETVDGLGSGFYSKSLGLGNLAGDAGSITIEAGSLTLEDGGVIVTDTNADPAGGNIVVDVTGNISISGNGMDGVVFDGGDAQKLFLNIFGTQALHSGTSGIFAASTGTGSTSGDSGTISVTADALTLAGNATISTSAAQAGGGQIHLNVTERLQLTDAGMETDVAQGGESGGDITIDPKFVILNNSTISANADAGQGGNISIAADHFIASQDSAVTASSKTGIDGNVVIESPHVNLVSGLASLPVTYLDASQWAGTPCESRTAEDMSRFEILPSISLAPSLDDFRAALPPPRDKRIDIYLEKADYEGLLAALEQREDSLEKTVWMAHALQALGKIQEAGRILNKGKNSFEHSHDLWLKSLYLSLKGDLALISEEKRTAIESLKLGLETAQKANAPLLEACLLNNLGILRSVNKDRFGAKSAYTKALALLNQTPEGPGLIPLVHTNLARQLYKAGKIQTAGEHMIRAAETLAAAEHFVHEAEGWIALFRLANRMPDMDPALSGIIEKGLLQAGRTASAIGSLRMQSLVNGCLGLLYEKRGNDGQALEKTVKALHQARLSKSSGLLFQWLRLLGRLSEKRGQNKDALLCYRHATATLGPVRMAYVNSFRHKENRFDEAIRPVYLEMAALFLNHPALLEQARDTMELLKRAELQNYFQDECFTARSRMPFAADAMAKGTALLYPISYPDHLSLLLMTRTGMKRLEVAVEKSRLESAAHLFRKGLEQGGSDFRPLARQLYDWIIRPLSGDLAGQNIDTLVVAPDGVLRLIPFSALYSGRGYLIEDMAVSTVSAASLTDLEPGSAAGHFALLNGLTVNREGFAPLPHVAGELAAIKKVVPGKVLMDEAFTLPNLRNEINGQNYNIMHMASHAVFGGKPENSFLLTYNGKLYMDELEQLVGTSRYRGQVLDLLMLSACETAMGDERAAFGIAGAAILAGARSTVATLWEADDRAAALLVSQFYNGFAGAHQTKAKALQAAQLKLLKTEGFGHPSFWAAFILIGNWQ